MHVPIPDHTDIQFTTNVMKFPRNPTYHCLVLCNRSFVSFSTVSEASRDWLLHTDDINSSIVSRRFHHAADSNFWFSITLQLWPEGMYEWMNEWIFYACSHRSGLCDSRHLQLQGGYRYFKIRTSSTSSLVAIGLGSTGNHFSLYLSYNFFIAALCGALLVLYMCGHLVVILTPTLPLISIPICLPPYFVLEQG